MTLSVIYNPQKVENPVTINMSIAEASELFAIVVYATGNCRYLSHPELKKQLQNLINNLPEGKL